MSMKNRNPLTKLTGDAALSRPKLGRLESTRNVRQSAFFNLSVLIGLVVSLCGVFLPPLAFGTLSEMSTSAALSGPDPVIVRARQIRGAEGTGSCGGGYDLGVGLVDLDHGLAAGSTTYDRIGVLCPDTYATSPWSEQEGASTLCERPGYFNRLNGSYI